MSLEDGEGGKLSKVSRLTFDCGIYTQM